MREQLLEGEAALRRMSPAREQLELASGGGRCTYSSASRSDGSCSSRAMAGGSQSRTARSANFAQRQRGELTQAPLLNALRQRIDRRQRFLGACRYRRRRVDTPDARSRGRWPATDLTEAAHAHAAREPCCCAREK